MHLPRSCQRVRGPTHSFVSHRDELQPPAAFGRLFHALPSTCYDARMDGKPKRRWLSFRLSTLLIAVAAVCIACGWCASQWRIVQERRAAKLLVNHYGHLNKSPATVNWFRRMLGDEGFDFIGFKHQTSAPDEARIRLAFPEASTVFRATKDPGMD